MTKKHRQEVEAFGGVATLLAFFGPQSAMWAVIEHIDALEPIPDDVLARAKAEHPAIQWYYIYHGVAALGRQNEAEKWEALAGILQDMRLANLVPA